MPVKWYGCQSVPRKVKGGGPQGAMFGLLEYLSQSNHSSDCVSEIVNLLTIGITSYNVKQQVANDLP